MIQTTVKYIWITLQADNQGEGGIFSLYALVKIYGKKLMFPAMIGATTLLADGMVTPPPITVSSEIEGLAMAPGLEHLFEAGNNLVIGIVMVILFLLFFFQRFCNQLIERAFGPIMFLWFTMLLVVGFSEVVQHIEFLNALSPHYTYEMLVQYPHGFWLLGAVFLCTTRAEALYSDLGNCEIKNIRISWIYIKISLVMCYLGQAAWMMNEMKNGHFYMEGNNPFFEVMPHWFLIPYIILATLASIIASQALISGSYTLINEAINLNFWPRVAVKQPTETKGQIYIPRLNALLCMGCLGMILYFKSSEHMEVAYGFFITLTMLMTTFLLGYYLVYVKK